MSETISQDYVIRLLKYIPGETFDGKTATPATLINIGRFVGNFENAIKVCLLIK